MQVKDIINAIEKEAPPMYQESYDNCGLQVGNPEDEVMGVLLSLDVTEAVVEEAMQRGCNMIVSHHPLIFFGLKRISGRNYVERIVQKAIKNDISIFASHTSLDNMYTGVNAKIAEKLMLKDTSILAARGNTLSKLYTYAPSGAAENVREALSRLKLKSCQSLVKRALQLSTAEEVRDEVDRFWPESVDAM